MTDASADPDVIPDTKDWTWVLERPCTECGFDASGHEPLRTGDAVRDLIATYEALLADDRAPERPAPGVWSAVEYGCHVRDVFRLFDERLASMRTTDDATFANWDQDVTALEDEYSTQSAAVVADELRDAGQRIAAAFDSVRPDELGRTGRRSDGAVFTIDSFARYFLHDPVHHVWDIEQGYATLAG